MDVSAQPDPAARMDAMYRLQRHIYDLTRKPYLLGRDVLIGELAIPSGGSVLEIGCGTARNLICIARRYPGARCFGVDVSAAMLATAGNSIGREKLGNRIRLAQADATAFDPAQLFGIARFDRVVISYALSMIPDWESVLRAAALLLADGGSLHIADFGNGDGLGLLRRGIWAWLDMFSVTPRIGLSDTCTRIAQEHGRKHRFRQLYRGYAALAELYTA